MPSRRYGRTRPRGSQRLRSAPPPPGSYPNVSTPIATNPAMRSRARLASSRARPGPVHAVTPRLTTAHEPVPVVEEQIDDLFKEVRASMSTLETQQNIGPHHEASADQGLDPVGSPRARRSPSRNSGGLGGSRPFARSSTSVPDRASYGPPRKRRRSE